MVKTSVGVWSRSIADWDLQRETLWEMMERLATYFLLLPLVSLAEADFTVSSKRDMRWVGVLDHLIIFLTPATLPPGGVGSCLSLPLMVSLVQLSLWSSSISQPSAQLRSSGLEIWREIARYRSSVFIIIIWCFHLKQFRDKIGDQNGLLSKEEQGVVMETVFARLHPRNWGQATFLMRSFPLACRFVTLIDKFSFNSSSRLQPFITTVVIRSGKTQNIEEQKGSAVRYLSVFIFICQPSSLFISGWFVCLLQGQDIT